MGQTHLSTPLTVELLKREISVTWLSKTGKFYGRLESTQSINIERQREQFRRSDDNNFSLAISKTFITGKIKNSQVILRRYNRNFNFQEVDEIIGTEADKLPCSVKSFDYWVSDYKILNQGFAVTVGNEDSNEFVRYHKLDGSIVTAYVRPYFYMEYEM